MTDRLSSIVRAGKAAGRRIGRVARYLILVVLLVAAGLGLGMGLREVLRPLLPTWLAQAVGEKAAATPEGGEAAEPGREIAFWKSSMIPNFVSPKPGVDPMGMDLIPVYVDELAGEHFVTLSPAQMENIGLRTATVRREEAERAVRTVGQVDYAEPRLGDVTLKVEGWVEQLLVDYVGQRVEKGQPLFRFYSPELVTAQEELLLDRRLGTEGQGAEAPVIYSAYDKLRYWDVPDDEIDAIRRAGKTKKAITFRSPFSGWVIEKHAYEGMHMKAGTPFYRIADLSTVWVYVYIYEYQLPSVQMGQPARLTLPFLPGEVFEGKVIYVYPNVDPKTRQIRVRLEFPNPELKLKPQMYANVEISAGRGQQTAVPLDAVIYTGDNEVVGNQPRRQGYAYVPVEPGKFEPRRVVLGEDLEGGRVGILSGLEDGEKVVVAGQFLLDAERKTQEANLRMFTTGQKDQTTDESQNPGAEPAPTPGTPTRQHDSHQKNGT